MSQDRVAAAVAEARALAADAVRRGLAAARAEQDRTRAKPDSDEHRPVRFDIEAFFTALDRKRRKLRLRWQDIAHATGVSKSTFTRMGYGHKPDADNLVRLLGWLGSTDLKPYVREVEQ